MDVEIEKPHVHHQRSGHRWFDFIVPIAALFVSFVSILIAWHHGEVMKELVHQNERLVEAESLPYLQIETSNLEPDLRTPALRLTVSNQGVGPGRISQVVVTVNGRPVPNFDALISQCCAPGLFRSAGLGKKQFRGLRTGDVTQSLLRDRMIRPGESVDAFDWPVTDANREFIDRLQREIASDQVNVSLCYCSVFDDCWTRADDGRRPTPVKQCPMAAVPYRQ